MRRNNGFGDTKAIRHRLDDIQVYEITEEQLNIIGGSSQSDLWLEIGLSLLSIFASFLCSLLSLDFSNSQKAFTFFLVVCIITSVLGGVFMIAWLRSRKAKSKVLDKIKMQKLEDEQS